MKVPRLLTALLLPISAGLFVAGCDVGRATHLSVEVQANGAVDPSDDLAVESMWLEDVPPFLRFADAKGVRGLPGELPTARTSPANPEEPGIPVVRGLAEVKYGYVTQPPEGNRPLGTTWLAVWRTPRTVWVPQEFVIVNGKAGPEVHRLVREKGAGSLGKSVGTPVALPSASSTTKAWRVVLPLEPWVKRGP